MHAQNNLSTKQDRSLDEVFPWELWVIYVTGAWHTHPGREDLGPSASTKWNLFPVLLYSCALSKNKVCSRVVLIKQGGRNLMPKNCPQHNIFVIGRLKSRLDKKWRSAFPTLHPPPPLHRSVKLWGVHTLLRDKKIRRKRALLSHSRAPVQCSTKLIFFIYVHRTPPDRVFYQ